jgi:hypothetical protein
LVFPGGTAPNLQQASSTAPAEQVVQVEAAVNCGSDVKFACGNDHRVA